MLYEKVLEKMSGMNKEQMMYCLIVSVFSMDQHLSTGYIDCNLDQILIESWIIENDP